jgi:hypothetical protein
MRAWGSILVGTAALLLLEPATAVAQLGDRITVPLSTPGQPATLRVSLLTGSIAVTAYDGNEMLIEPHMRDEDDAQRIEEEAEREAEREARRREREAERRERQAGRGGGSQASAADEADRADRAAGLRRVRNRSAGLTIDEHDNEVTVSGPWHSRAVDLDIKVPAATSVHLATVNDGDIVVRNVRGEIEAQNTNGRVTLTHVSGPVVAHALNGDVVATMGAPMPDRPTSLSSMNGDIDLTLPADAKATIWIRADNGDIYTDFDLDLESRSMSPEVGDVQRKKRKRYSVETGMSGTLNGGGAEIRLVTYNGSVYIRRAK